MGKDILDILLDENNTEPIQLKDEQGRLTLFEQIAVIPYQQKIYCILKPIDKIYSVSDDEAIVFCVEEEDDTYILKIVNDENISLLIFEEYYDLLEESLKEGGD